LDNAPIHHSYHKRIQAGLPSIQDQLVSKNVEPRFIVPYSPELNPVELCFNFIKQQVEKAKPRTLPELKLAIERAVAKLNRMDLTKFFRHCFQVD
jgi:transposase